MLTTSVSEVVKVLLAEETDRDKQRLVGASNISNPCTRCLARDMAAMLPNATHEPAPRGKWFMGAVIGTFIHSGMEVRGLAHPDLMCEYRVTLGDIPGYGTVKSTTDLYIKSLRTSVDYKTTTKHKLAMYQEVVKNTPNKYSTTDLLKAESTLKQYLVQLMLYGWGVIQSGLPVQNVAVAFICRDAKTLDDVWVHEVPYSQKVAEAAFDRAARIWQALEQGKPWDSFKSSVFCFQCNSGF